MSARLMRMAFFKPMLSVVLLAALVSDVYAADSVVTFDNPEHAARYQALLKEYRCLKCQNQNLSDSNADLARDLRLQIQSQVVAGKSKADIDEYLVARYGDFVLYRPRFNLSTALLWLGPFVLLVIALVFGIRIARHSERELSPPDSEAIKRARDLLDSDQGR